MLRTPETPTSPLPEIDNFTLYYDEQAYVFEGDIFIKMSKKAARLALSGKTDGEITEKVSEETFKTFCSACELKSFNVNLKNVYELQKLAKEWEVPSLEKYVDNYIQEKNIPAPPTEDYLGILIEHCNAGIEDPQDILNVAEYINNAFRDDRFETLPAEELFKVCNAADPQKIDNQQFINFTLQLLETNPPSAVPLLLLIDFDRLTKDQRNHIFRSPQVHEQNIGYFIANSLSTARNKNDADSQQAEAQLNEDLTKMKDLLIKQQDKITEKLIEAENEQLEKLEQDVQDMQKQIEALKDSAAKQRQRIQQNSQNHDDGFDDIKDRLAHIEELTSNRKDDDNTEQIRNEVSEQLEELTSDYDSQIKQLADEDAKFTQKKQRELKRAIDEEQKRLKQLRQDAEGIVDSLNESNEELTDLKATLASKIVRDRLRFDKFIRKVDNRLDLFKNEPGVWGLDAERVGHAEKFINEIEDEIDKNCPIRGKKNE